MVARVIASCGYPTINRLSASQHIRCRGVVWLLVVVKDILRGQWRASWPVQLVEHLTVDIADIRRSLARFRVARLCTLVANALQHVQVSERYENPAKESMRHRRDSNLCGQSPMDF